MMLPDKTTADRLTPPPLEVYRPAPAATQTKTKRTALSYSADAIAIWNALGARQGIRNAWTNKDGIVWSVWMACQDGLSDGVKRELWEVLDREQIEKVKEMSRLSAPNTSTDSP